MYVDPITRQTYDYATPITCHNNPRNIIELDPNSDDQDYYILDQTLLNDNHQVCSHLLKLKLHYVLTLSQSKMLAQILMLNLINFGTEFYFQKILILYFKF